ncbi:hypothetical protein ILUMI_06267 [Ignelater luminosus]|uniref:HCLS1-associated protein X-1 n=1 Tax=Ignelater luminosus TaxID=2038154 RepID=A0A8K0DB17_IGNLU|nr:hypothetical protein ILUMI_06267 [Ignelater luminosus]
MNFLNRIKSYLGFPASDSDHSLNTNKPIPKNSVREEVITRDRDNNNEYVPDNYDRFGFNIFSNPLEVHRYFEHQMNEMMKSFGVFGNHDFFFGGNGEPFFDDNSFGKDFPQFPAIEDFHKQQDQSQRSLREQFLKPGYEQPKISKEHKSDQDIDGRFDMGDLDSVLKGTPSQPQVKTFMYGQSMSTKTVRKPDGTIETHRTVRDQQGNEETTVTRRQGDKEYSITTRTDKDGQKEIVENLVNMDENDKDAFLKATEPYGVPPKKPPPNWFPFDRFF